MADFRDILAALSSAGPQVDPQQLAPQAQTEDQAAYAPADPNVVPAFQPPPNPAVPIHHGFLARVGQALNGVGQAVAGFGGQGIPDSVSSLLSPHDLAQAHSARWLALSNSLLNPQYDARGFRQSTLGSLASGAQAAQQAGQQSIGGSLQAAQYASQVQQQRALLAGRQQLAQQFAFNPADTQNEQLRKLDGLAAGLVGLGDYHGAEAAAAAAKSLREGSASGGRPYSPLPLGDHYGRWDNATGTPEEYDPKTKTWVPAADLTKREIATVVQEKDRTASIAETNSTTHRQSAFQTQFVKPFSKMATAFASWDSVLPQALPNKDFPEGNPAATKAAITAFVGAMEPNVQLRYATLQYLSDINPSWAAMARKWIQTGKYGTIPPDMLQAMDKVEKAKEAKFSSQYQTTVGRGLQMYPELTNKAPTWNDLKGVPATAEPAADENPFR